MSRFPKAAPGEGDRKDFENWSYWSIKKGEEHFAYVAGECVWLVCHPSERTKPCLRWWTKGALPCKLCGKNTQTVELGYFPVWRGSDWRPKFIVVYSPERELIDRLRLHQRVVIGKENEKGAANFVRLAANQEPPFNTTREDRKRPADLTHPLLIAWEIPELTMWCAGQHERSDNALSLDNDRPAGIVPEKPADAHKPDAQPYSAPDPLHAGVAFDGTLNRLKDHVKIYGAEPSKNGKHEGEG